MSPNPVPDRPPAGSARLVIVAAVLALIAVVLTNVYVEYVKRVSEEGTITRFRLTQSLRPGERLKDRDIVAVKLPARYEDAFRTYINDKERDSFIGRQVLRYAEQGEFLAGRMFEASTDKDLDDEIAPGMRLYPLPVNSRMAIGGLRPGMVVDIEAPFTVQGKPVVLPVMENVKVIVVGAVSTLDERTGSTSRISTYQTISIEVLPQATAKLSMIEKMASGPFELTLRNRLDEKMVKIPNADPQTGINPSVLDMLPAPGPRGGN